MLAGQIKVLGGPHVARGPDVAQACTKDCYILKMAIDMIRKQVNIWAKTDALHLSEI